MIPLVGRIVRPPKDAIKRLRNLHVEACRVAETKPDILGHEEVARTLQHEYIHALVNCLTAEDAHVNLPPNPHYADIALRFEDALLDYIGRGRNITQLCEGAKATKARRLITVNARR
jgi:hypothetical protein